MSELVDAAGSQTVTAAYTGTDANFTATYTVAADGTVAYQGLTSMTRQLYVPITVAGAAHLSVLKFGAPGTDQSAMTASVDVNDPAKVKTDPSVGSTWDWYAPNDGNSHRFYYEAVDATNKVIGKGYGTMTLTSTGMLTCQMDAPLLKPSVVT